MVHELEQDLAEDTKAIEASKRNKDLSTQRQRQHNEDVRNLHSKLCF